MKSEKIPYTKPANLECSISLIARLHDILETGQYTAGKYCAQFEQSFKDQFNLRGECIAVNGCQNGLFLTLVALGIHRPLIPDFTFSATAHAAYYACRDMKVGDVNSRTFNLEAKGRPECDCIVGVHCFGNPCDVAELQSEADDLGVPLLFDAAHAIGATFKGRAIGDYGRASIFSLSPTKNLTSCEGGMIVTSDECLANKLKTLRNYGSESDYDCQKAGMNARLSELHAIIGLESLYNFNSNFKKRIALAEEYISHFPPEMIQQTTPDSTHSWKDFSILVGAKRGRIDKALTEAHIDFKHYFRPISHLSWYDWILPQPNARRVYDSILQLPLYPDLEPESVRKICRIVLGELNGADVTASPHVTVSRPEIVVGVNGNHQS